MKTNTLAPELLHKMDACWRAANYLSVGQIYLYENPLLKRPLKLSDVKPLVVGHWGTSSTNITLINTARICRRFGIGSGARVKSKRQNRWQQRHVSGN